jgi:hypothetical protein
MALIGTYNIIEYIESETETVQLTDPETGETITEPLIETRILETFENAYVRVANVNVWKKYDNELRMDLNFLVYASEGDANQGELEDNKVHQGFQPLLGINSEQALGNVFIHAYNTIKQLDIFEGFTDC